MRWARSMKGLVLLLLLQLPILAAVILYTGSTKHSAAARWYTPAALPTAMPVAMPTDLQPSMPMPTPMAAPMPMPMSSPVLPVPAPLAWAQPLTPTALPGAASQQGQTLPSAGTPTEQVAGTGLPSPLEQNAAAKEFIEGHWLGLEVIPLVPELAREYGIAENESGILVDEVTLEAAESGILAGDLVHAIEGQPTPDLRAFFQATQKVRQNSQATIEVQRRGRAICYTLRARNAPELGFAQMEAAQPIAPGAISPHRTRSRACTECHLIMQSGGQLPTDAGDIVPTPGSIQRDAVAPHRYRGPCSSCHTTKALP